MADRSFSSDVQTKPQSLESLSTDEFLNLIGQRIRFHRTEEKMSRKRLAEVSGVSERYLAQLEAGQGNMSIALLRKVTTAIKLPLNMLLADLDADTANPIPSAPAGVLSNSAATTASQNATRNASAHNLDTATNAEPEKVAEREPVAEV